MEPGIEYYAFINTTFVGSIIHTDNLMIIKSDTLNCYVECFLVKRDLKIESNLQKNIIFTRNVMVLKVQINMPTADVNI